MKVYIVSSGSYDTEQIDAVYTDKNLADEYVRRGNLTIEYKLDQFDIQEFELNPPIPKDFPK